ncbi:MAG: tyrosine-protein phosphatase [Sedimentisphaerales bacterium]|nr:tyrosine-protein phosphatase [Sedimentisphaerales bacterium]
MKPDRRKLLCSVGVFVALAVLGCIGGGRDWGPAVGTAVPPAGWINPDREFSMAPFWFWNDRLSEKEITRQLDDFCRHGVYGFVIHPRAGLPENIGWMSDAMIKYMRFAIEQAAKRRMWVVLYDEGMYPSGSSSGQVVAENRAFKTRGLFAVDLDEAKPDSEVRGVKIAADGKPNLKAGQNLIAIVNRKTNGHRIAVVDRAISDGYSVIRGLHFRDGDPARRADRKEVAENSPDAADILNPDAVQCFIRLVYQRYYDEFGEHFGKTIKGVFTDEPSFMAKRAERGAVAGTAGILEHVNSFLGYDFTPHLPALWYGDEPEAKRYRADYYRALQNRLEQTFYAPISKWCSRHNVALAGHPAKPDDIGHLRYFQMPGQDIVWRYIEPGKSSAIEGAQSTQAKCASSAMIHLGRRRNSNEYCGAYGHNFTFAEMQWLTRWLAVRGCNLFYPHAFYYSVRGPRIDERPPDVGPNSAWWPQYRPFADSVRRLCWLNTDSRHVCEIAILGLNDHLPWEAAKVCFQNQYDFNYLEARHLWEDCRVDKDGIRIRGMHYKALIVEGDVPAKANLAVDILDKAGRVIRWNKNDGEAKLLQRIGQLVQPDVRISPASKDLRVRHVVKEGADYYIFFNEGQRQISFRAQLSAIEGLEGGQCPPYLVLETESGNAEELVPGGDIALSLGAHQLRVVMISGGRNGRWAQKVDLPGVPNLYKVSDVLYRSAQPTAEGMKELEKMGIKTVLNLRSSHSDRDELQGTNMRYEHLKMRAWNIKDADVEAFLRIVRQSHMQPVLVHCQHGSDRTGVLCAVYRAAVEDWNKDEAIKEMTTGGYGYHSKWKNLVTYIRRLDIAELKKKMQNQ